MASLNRVELEELYQFLKKAFAFAPTKSLAEEARVQAMRIENCIGQQEQQGAETWK